MGVIQKGSTLSTFYLAIGILLGFVTSGLILPNYFTEEQNGVITVLNSYYLIYSQIALLGLHTTVIRFFPHFRNEENRHHGFLTVMSMVILISMVLFSILFSASWYLVPQFFDQSDAFGKYYWLSLPLTGFTVYFYLFDAYFSVRLKGATGFLLKDVVQRVLIIITMLAFISIGFEFSLFVIIYCISICIPTLIFLFSLIRDKQFGKPVFINSLYADNWRYMAKVSGYSLLLGISWVGITNLDAIIIEKMLGIKEAGIYGRNMFFGILVSIPYRAIHKISSGVLSNSFKENDLDNVRSVYYKSSLNQTIIGLFILGGIWINIHNVYQLIPVSYEAGKYVILFVGLGQLFTMIGGVNTGVISFSPYYRWNTIFVIILLTLVIITNLIFIPLWGITGAAVSIAISLFLYNLMMYILLYIKYKFQPIKYQHLVLVGIAALSYLIVIFIPVIPGSFLIDIAVRSVAFTLLFGIPVWVFKISPDINNLVNSFKNKLFKKSV